MQFTRRKILSILILFIFTSLPIFAQEFVYVSVEKADLKSGTGFFSEKISEKLRSNNASPVQGVPGNADAPYYIPLDEEKKPAKFLKAKPKTDLSKCVKCGICSANCPTAAIDTKDFSEVTGICIKCQSCIHKCPKQAKYFDDPVFASHVRYVVKNYQDRKENEFFL